MGHVRVHDIMQKNAVTIAAGDRLSTAEDIMTLGGVRHMPVVQGGRLVGVVTERDLLRASLSSVARIDVRDRRAFLGTIEISQIMSSPAVVTHPKDSVEDAALMMASRKIGCLPVVDDRGELVGLVTETGLLRYLAHAAERDASLARGSEFSEEH